MITGHAAHIKQHAYKILDKLPDQVTWDDLMYQIYGLKTI